MNGQYRDDTDIGKLMHDFCCSDPDDMLIPMLAERTRYLKTDEKEVKHMCEQMERIENKGVAKGIGIGETNKAKDMAINLNNMGVDIEVIAKSANVSVDQVKEWLAKK